MQTKQELITELKTTEEAICEMVKERRIFLDLMTSQCEQLLKLEIRLADLANLIRDSWPDGQDPADFWKD